MKTSDALYWIGMCHSVFGDAPGTIGKSEEWIKEAGIQCFEACRSGAKAPTNDDIYGALGLKKLDSSIVL